MEVPCHFLHGFVWRECYYLLEESARSKSGTGSSSAISESSGLSVCRGRGFLCWSLLTQWPNSARRAETPR